MLAGMLTCHQTTLQLLLTCSHAIISDTLMCCHTDKLTTWVPCWCVVHVERCHTDVYRHVVVAHDCHCYADMPAWCCTGTLSGCRADILYTYDILSYWHGSH